MSASACAAGGAGPLLAPDPLHPLVVHAPALDPQAPVDQPPAPAHVAPGQLPDPLPQLVLLNVCHRHAAGIPGIDPAEASRPCSDVPGSEVSLRQLLLLRRSQGLEHGLIEFGVSEQSLEPAVLLLKLFDAFGL